MSETMKGKVALVTGAGSGIGRAIALAFVSEGASVIVADINEKDGSETGALVKEKAQKVFLFGATSQKGKKSGIRLKPRSRNSEAWTMPVMSQESMKIYPVLLLNWMSISGIALWGSTLKA